MSFLRTILMLAVYTQWGQTF